MNENMYAHWLISLTQAGAACSRRLFEYAGSFKGIWEMDEEEFTLPSLKIPEETRRLIISSKDEKAVTASYESLKAQGITFLNITDPSYPAVLKNIFDPPLGLYLKGRLPDPEKKSVAVVGARNCSEYGARSARKISTALAGAGFQIISGMAYGIDGIAQNECMNMNRYSCGVLGCGVDICYPKDNTKLYEQLTKEGGLISEFPPGTPPAPANFPRRNRIISGLSDIVIVIEARARSGSLITADMALEQGRDVYALPGRICDALSAGSNRLIKQGAGIITSPEELIADLMLNNTVPLKEEAGHQMDLTEIMGLNEDEKLILGELGYDPISLNSIQDKTKLDSPRLMRAVTGLSLKGIIRQDSGYYVRCG